LQNNGIDDLVIHSNGSFVFDTALADGSGYSVSVRTQPANPDQTCSVSNSSGTVSGANVTSPRVICATDQETIMSNGFE
jgi:hypothetical protein